MAPTTAAGDFSSSLWTFSRPRRRPDRTAQGAGFGLWRGGWRGKSDSLLGAGIIAAFFIPGVSIGYFRRQYSDLAGSKGPVMRSFELLSRDWCHWDGEHHRWTFPNGSVLAFCHAKDESDVYNYKSWQFDILLIDESTQFTREMYRYLMTRNRATVPGVVPFCAMATNPGDIGHAWFKAEFADLPPETPQDIEIEPGRFERHMFIPALLKDNEILESRDPGYRATLEGQNEMTRRQLLEGDWSAFSGQYFSSWRRDIHVIPTPKDMTAWLRATCNHKKFRCLDYGLDMTACYWIDIAPGGRLTVYRELYKPNLILSKAAKAIIDFTTPLESIAYTVVSPDLWNRRQDTGESGIDGLKRGGWRAEWPLRPADDRRVTGWQHMAEWLEPYVDPEWLAEMEAKGLIRFQDAALGPGWRSADGSEQYYDEQDGRKLSSLVFMDCCGNAIKQIPSLIRDENNPNDVSDKAPDHAGEAIRYGLMSRPKPFVVKPDPLAILAEKYPAWTPTYQVQSRDLMRGDPKRWVDMDDLGM